MALHPDAIKAVRDFCRAIEEDSTRSTKAVLLHLEADGFLNGPDWQKNYRDLDDAAHFELSDCATRAEPIERMSYGRLVKVRPWLWHTPDGLGPRERTQAEKTDKWAEWRASVDARLNEILRILTDNN